jgi:hypothetical protein
VIPVLTEPGRPDQNGRHERFHETLKEETASPPRASIRAQQGAFDAFQQSYNDERPHEALGMKPPSEVYELSPRSMPAELAEHSYGKGFEARSVRQDGSMKWDGKFVFVGEAFAGEVVGLSAFDLGEHLKTDQLGSLQNRPVEGCRRTVCS